MKRLVVIMVVLAMFLGCAQICKTLTPERRERVSQTLHWLQANYQPLLALLKVKEGADPKAAAIASGVVIAVDLALNALGTMLEQDCVDETALDGAVLAAEKAEAVVGKYGGN